MTDDGQDIYWVRIYHVVVLTFKDKRRPLCYRLPMYDKVSKYISFFSDSYYDAIDKKSVSTRQELLNTFPTRWKKYQELPPALWYAFIKEIRSHYEYVGSGGLNWHWDDICMMKIGYESVMEKYTSPFIKVSKFFKDVANFISPSTNSEPLIRQTEESFEREYLRSKED